MSKMRYITPFTLKNYVYEKNLYIKKKTCMDLVLKEKLCIAT